MKIGGAILLTVGLFFTAGAQAQTRAPLRLVQTIPLPNVEGYIDHLAVDIKGQRLFVPAEHKKSIEVVDLRAGKIIHSIDGFGGDPRKTVYLPQTNQLWVDDGDGTCKVFSGDSYALVKTIPLSDSKINAKLVPDNGTYDPVTQNFYVAVTLDMLSNAQADVGTIGFIATVDTKAGKFMGVIDVKGADPAGISVDPSSPKMYVIVGDTAQVAVIDRDKHAVIASWPITGGPEPHTMDLDAVHHRLFIGSRVKPGHMYEPGKMIVMDSETGKIVQALDSVGGADEIIYDPANQRVYLAGTTGFVDVFKQIDADHYQLLAKVPTGALAKTALLVPELKRFYVAVPKHVVLTPPIPQAQEQIVEESKLMVFDVLP